MKIVVIRINYFIIIVNNSNAAKMILHPAVTQFPADGFADRSADLNRQFVNETGCEADHVFMPDAGRQPV